MTAQFPAAIVSTGNIPDTNPLTTLSANNHAGKHNDMRDEIIAIETKIGATGSVVTTSLEYKTKNITAGDQAVGATQTVSLSNKTNVSPKVIVGSDAIGDTLYNSSGATGVQSRIPIGSTGQVLTSSGTVPIWSSPTATNTSYIVDTGAANAYVATLSPALGAYSAGVLVQFKAANANTTASTVNVNGLGVKTIKKLGGATDLVAGDIAAGQIVELEYDGTNFQMLSPVANAPLSPTGDGSNLTGIKLGFAKNGALTVSTATTNTITIGFQARAIRLSGASGSGSSTSWFTGSWDVTTGGGSCSYIGNNGSFFAGTTNAAGYIANNGAGTTTFQISNITATTFDIVSTTATSYATGLAWEAIA